jgi:hypothetical protein
MADQKISALSDGSPVVSTDNLVLARGTANYRLAAADLAKFMPGYQLDYVVHAPSDLTVTATNAAAAQTLIDGNPVTFDGSTTIQLSWYAIVASNNGTLIVRLWDGATDLGSIAMAYTSVGTTTLQVSQFLTPTAGSHTFHIRVYKDATGATTSVSGSAGFPSWYRITRA